MEYKQVEKNAQGFVEQILRITDDPEGGKKIVGGIAASLGKEYSEVTVQDYRRFSGDTLRDFYYGIIY